jgi:hypothetical protein
MAVASAAVTAVAAAMAEAVIAEPSAFVGLQKALAEPE